MAWHSGEIGLEPFQDEVNARLTSQPRSLTKNLKKFPEQLTKIF